MAEYIPEVNVKELDWLSGTLRVVEESGVTVVLFVSNFDDKVYVLDVKGVEV